MVWQNAWSSLSKGASPQIRHVVTFIAGSRISLSYRTTPHAVTGVTPAQLFLGRELKTRLSLVKPDPHTKVENKQSSMVKDHGYREFYPGDSVTVKDIRKDTWWDRTVVERSGPKSYTINLRDGRIWKRHVDHMKRADAERPPALLAPEAETSEPGPHAYPPPCVDHGLEPPKEPVALAEQPDVPKPPTVETPQATPMVPVVPVSPKLRRSGQERKVPSRLIETV